jgi:hypothetical protein
MEEFAMEGDKSPARRTGRTGSPRPAASVAKKATGPAARPRKVARTDAEAVVMPEDRRQMVEMAAYFRAESRGFEPGHEVEDWLAAEAGVDLILLAVPEGRPVPKPRKTKGA